jgi:hypothetical protein
MLEMTDTGPGFVSAMIYLTNYNFSEFITDAMASSVEE